MRPKAKAVREERLPPVGSKGRRSAGEEYSAGGVAAKDGRVLLVQVENLKGEKVWTFPKGHLDPGETPMQAALREVREETGWECEVLAPLTLVRYMFRREGRLVKKRVRWYWMKPVRDTGAGPDAKEVLGLQWCDAPTARAILKYPGDKKLMDLIEPKLPESYGQ